MPSDRGAGGRLWPDLVGAFVVAVAFAFATLLAMGIIGPSDSEGTSSPATAEGALNLDVGEVSEGAVADCIADGFAGSPDEVVVDYESQQLAEEGSSPVLLLRNEEGDVRLCDMFGLNRPAEVPQPVATPATPAVFFTVERQRWQCTDEAWEAYAIGTWLAVTDPVAYGQLRFLVDGRESDWFTSEARNGFVHLQAWLRDPPVGSEILIEVRLLDESGDRVSSEGVEPGPFKALECPGADIEIG